MSTTGITLRLLKSSKDYHWSCSDVHMVLFLYEAHGHPQWEDLIVSPRLLQDGKL